MQDRPVPQIVGFGAITTVGIVAEAEVVATLIQGTGSRSVAVWSLAVDLLAVLGKANVEAS